MTPEEYQAYRAQQAAQMAMQVQSFIMIAGAVAGLVTTLISVGKQIKDVVDERKQRTKQSY